MEWCKLAIETVTAIISLIAILLSLKAKAKPTIGVSKITHSHEHHYVYDHPKETQRVTATNNSPDMFSVFFLSIAAMAIGIFLYLKYAALLETTIAVLSLTLCLVGVFLHRRYSVETKEELRSAYIVTQPIIFNIVALICFQYHKLEEPLQMFSDAVTWHEVASIFSSSFAGTYTATVILAVYCLCTVAFYALQIVALSSLIARFYILYDDKSHRLLTEWGNSLWAFFPAVATGILLFATVFYGITPLS